MLIEGSSDIVQHVHTRELNGHYVELIELHSGQVIALGAHSIALYKSLTAVGDPLGNGLVHSVDIPTTHHLNEDKAPWVQSHTAGFVGLENGMALLILPNDIKLYEGKASALRNHKALCELTLT